MPGLLCRVRPTAEQRHTVGPKTGFGRLRNQLWLAIVAATFAFSAIVPTGHMVAIGAGFSLEIVPCPSKNALARALQTKGAHHTGASSDHADHTDHTDHHQGIAADEEAGDDPSSPDCELGTFGFGGPAPAAAQLVDIQQTPSTSPLAALPELALGEPKNLRPPLRAPPFKS